MIYTIYVLLALNAAGNYEPVASYNSNLECMSTTVKLKKDIKELTPEHLKCQEFVFSWDSLKYFPIHLTKPDIKSYS